MLTLHPECCRRSLIEMRRPGPTIRATVFLYMVRFPLELKITRIFHVPGRTLLDEVIATGHLNIHPPLNGVLYTLHARAHNIKILPFPGDTAHYKWKLKPLLLKSHTV